MGQVLFFPPNVKGRDKGKSWINTATLTFRYKFARQLINGINPTELGMLKPMEAISGQPAITLPLSVDQIVEDADREQPSKLIEQLALRIFQGTPEPKLSKTFTQFVTQKPLPLDDNTIRDLLVLMMNTPNYQIS